MKSMTGYGRAEGVCGLLSCSAEISSVNRKNLDVKISLPENLMRLEIPLRRLVASKLSRGMISVRISLKDSGSRGASSGPNMAELENCHARLEALRLKLEIKSEISISDLLLSPAAFEDISAPDSEDFDRCVVSTASAALDNLDQMRRTEGEALRKDILDRLAKLPPLISDIQKRCADSVPRRRDVLLSRLNSIGLGLDFDDERLAKELAIFAEKCDVSEEITRLGSHFAQFAEVSMSDEANGKNLDFIAQEMQREIGTLSAKTSSAEISPLTISFKSELEKIREQVQNVE